jgi:hypothetical protein
MKPIQTIGFWAPLRCVSPTTRPWKRSGCPDFPNEISAPCWDFATFEYRRWWIFHRIFHLFVISLEVTTGFLIIAKIDGFPYLLLDAGFSW